MPDRDTTKRMFTHMINMMEQHDTMIISCGDPLMELLKDVRELLKESERKTGSWDYGTQCSVCKGTIIPPKDRKIRVNFCPWCGADMRGGYDA